MKKFSSCLVVLAVLSLIAAPALAQSSVPPGTRATLALQGWLSSEDAEVGDTFEAKLVEAISVEGQEVVPAGSIFVGRVAAVQQAQGRSRGGELTLVIDRLVSGQGDSAAAPGTITGVEDGDLEGKDNTGKSAGIGAAIGGVAGAILGGGKGALIGAAIGAGGGIAAGRGKDVQLPEGTRLLVKFDSQVTVTWDWRPQT